MASSGVGVGTVDRDILDRVKTIIVIIIGAVIGAALADEGGAMIAGAVLGYLLVVLRRMLRRLDGLQREVTALDSRLTSSLARSVEPAVAPAPALEPEPIPEPAPRPTTPEPVKPGPAPTMAARPPQIPASRMGGVVDDSGPLGRLMDRAFKAARAWLFGGNTVVRVGVFVLIVGVGLLAKYAADHQVFPVELRLAFAAVIGLVLIAVGWKQRDLRKGFGTTLQGGGTGALYITVFFALRTYHLIPVELAFVLLVALSVFSGVLAVVQDAVFLAVMGIVAGFLAPVIASTGQGQHVILFGYYALLNAGIVGIAWFKPWRALNLLGFFFTFGIGSWWGALSYRPESFATTEPFLILFFVFYVAVAVLFAWRSKPRLGGMVDGTLVFGTPIIVSVLQTALVEPFEMGMAWSAFGLAFFYISLATILHRVQSRDLRNLVEAFLAIGIGFATLAIPLALDDHQITATTWALEGAGLLWVGVRQRRWLSRYVGGLLQLAAAIAFAVAANDAPYDAERLPLVNGTFVGCMTLAFAAFFIHRTIWKNREHLHHWEVRLYHPMLLWGLFWWSGGGVDELDELVPSRLFAHGVLVFFAASALVLDVAGQRLRWLGARLLAVLIWPMAFFFLLVDAADVDHPLERWGALAWGLLLAVFVILLWRQDRTERRRWLALGHAATGWIVVILVAWEATWALGQLSEGSAWPVAAMGLVCALAVPAISGACQRVSWPFRQHRASWMLVGLGPVIVAGLSWTLVAAITSNGDPWPLPYLPLLNPLDVATVLVLLATALWLGQVDRRSWPEELNRAAQWGLPVIAFVWLNVMLARTVHHWAHVRYHSDALLNSTVMQATLSISWTLVALGTMLVATRRRSRTVWITAAVLLGVVVVKLFLVDLSTLSTVAKIVSFLVVGGLLVLIGFVSPVPPVHQQRSEEHDEVDAGVDDDDGSVEL